MLSEQQVRAFAAQWPDCEVEVVGMAECPNGDWVAADGAGLAATHWDCIVVGRNAAAEDGALDVLNMVEDATLRVAREAAITVTLWLFNNCYDWSER